MARPLRIELPGAHYHVTSRGDRRERIFEDDVDRRAFLDIVGDVVESFEWRCHAYCLMGNHYHLFVETPQANLSKGMRQLNGVYTQWSNRRHDRNGHLFQGRYKSILVDTDAYLLQLSRYIVLNPVRAGMVEDPADWPWSSYRATAGLTTAPPWLTTWSVLAGLGPQGDGATAAYRQFVGEGIDATGIWSNLTGQVFLGNDHFVDRMQRELGKARDDAQIPRAQRSTPAPSLEQIEREARQRDDAIVAAYATGAYSYAQIGEHFGLHFASVGRIVRRAKRPTAGKMLQS